jgi:hypothetical protein
MYENNPNAAAGETGDRVEFRNPKKLEEWWDLDLPSYGIDTEKSNLG